MCHARHAVKKAIEISTDPEVLAELKVIERQITLAIDTNDKAGSEKR